MKVLLTNIVLAIVWIFLTGHFTYTNFIFGFVLGYIVILLTRPLEGCSKYSRKIPSVIGFALFFIWELLKANFRLAYDVVTPRDYMRPGIVSYKLEAESDIEITLLMNLISLTPGTLSLDVSSDKKVLYIHAIYVGETQEFREEMRQFECRLLEVLR